MNIARCGFRISRFGLLSFRHSTASSLHRDAPPLINGQPDKCGLEEWRRDTVFPPAFYKVTRNVLYGHPEYCPPRRVLIL
jgi:hypothetical protein